MEKIKSGIKITKSILLDQTANVQNTDFIKLRIHPPIEDGSVSLIQSFLQLERYNGIQWIQIIHKNLTALSKVI